MRKMESISCKEVRENMSDVINQVAFKSKRYTVTRHGSAVAILLSLEEWNSIEKLIEQKEDKEDICDADIALQKHFKKQRRKPGVLLKSMKKKLGI
jgi:prevent-host-death family protein